ncbi:MAG: hypothetical protein J7L20_04270, partial [Thermoplasmata archaeon]|nr:hypothetical protein [Thermoplasmata archaeon]
MKLIGIYTKNFLLYHDLIKALKAREVGYEVISDPRKIPNRIGVIITSSLEKEKFKGKRLVIADYCKDALNAVDRAIQVLNEGGRSKEIFIGIDPGEYPEIAPLYGERVPQTWGVSAIHRTIPQLTHPPR